jgi:transmembrane 9 superfamily protein 3
VQLFLLVLVLLLLAVASSYTEERGLLTALFLLCYSLTSGAQGYVSGAFFKQHGGRQWQRAMAVACCFYPLCVISVVFFLNAVAWQQGSQPVLSFSTALVITLVWALVSVPLSIGGTLLARSRTQTGAFPCRVNAIRRLIPSESLVSAHSSGGGGGGVAHQPLNVNTSATSVWSNWYLLVVMGGLLPFGSCFVELYSILTSFWNYSVSYVGGFVLLVFVIFILVSACVSIVATYVLLNSEDYRWHWLAFLASASSSLYIALYALYFFVAKTNMDGVLQTSFYCAYSAMALLTLSLITGSIGSIGTRLFLYKLYSYTKAD